MGTEVQGLRPMLRVLSRMPKEIQAGVRADAQRIVEPIAAEARRRAATPQQRLVAPTIRAVKDRVPTIKAAGAKALPSSTRRRVKPKAYQVYFGADFGSNNLRQFPPKVRGGRLIYPAVEDKGRHIADSYFDIIEDAFMKGARRG